MQKTDTKAGWIELLDEALDKLAIREISADNTITLTCEEQDYIFERVRAVREWIAEEEKANKSEK